VSPAATYRATVQSFDKVLLEAPPLQAPWHRCQECVR